MYAEINAAIQFLGQFLYNKLPRRKVNLFLEQLANNFVRRYDSWNCADPPKGNDNRCIRVKVRGQVDPMISVTAMAFGLNIEEILQCFPGEIHKQIFSTIGTSTIAKLCMVFQWTRNTIKIFVVQVAYVFLGPYLSYEIPIQHT